MKGSMILVWFLSTVSSVLAETSSACPPPADQTVTVVCLSQTTVTVHAASVASAEAALQLADKRPLPRPAE